jgi:transcription-repair coupling factor (superfamily II helicase)
MFFEYLVKDDHSRNVYVVTKQKERLIEVFNEFPNREKIKQAINIFEGSLNSGWRVVYPDGIEDLLLTDSELFGWEIPRPRRRKSAGVEAPELNYADLTPGDWVVHIDYGIGKFGGLVKRYLEGVERDYLLIEYAESDQLYVPVYQADRISTYVGVDQQKPGLTRLGSLQWTTAKIQARHAVKEVAEDLISLYSKRQIATGYAFSPDTPWQKMLESSFPYIETDDQLEAIIAVKQDMEQPRPMDRLLCGDVGYGKTEVALRAAFKAVMDGKQVGMLVPTTVLAQQHFDTFRSRLAPFPIQVEMLSRFRTPAEQAEVILKLESGDVDIVIGTHRLLQKDVIFKDLGLLIIDEEQRFGVAHKEYFKKFRAEIDVITLTATPIPRTLYMAISGIRDISIINSPPSDRLPIHTYIGGYEPKLVRQAIMRELDRGGQVFFVHNRVQTINSMAAHICQLVPEARLSIAHGQMPEKELAEVMHRFTSGDVDVLLSTSIIESGLDIPNANTLIVDRGDTFGLAQLYQLRGRVGRGASRAYAYFFHHRKKMPTIDGLERLEIIAENAHLGAGYSIAMRDLEMRGAGNILGTMQHGHIAAVGFHLYTRLLAEAVREINGKASQTNALQDVLGVREIKPLVSVELPISVGIPESYIPDEGLRLQLYRRIADITEEDQIQAMKEEFHDRFGPFGEEVDHLFWQYHVKLMAESCGIVSIGIEGNQIAMRFPQLENGVRQRDIPEVDPPVRKGKNGYCMPYQKDENCKQNLLQFLNGLAALMKTRM